jgi:vacuolar-type H+-ATPase subunit I/STV1
MATERQMIANRENAQHSTGPRTAEGKAAASRNHSTHGLTARGLIIRPDQQADFDAHAAGLRSSLVPTGELQELLFARILESSWNLHRCRLAEEQLCSESGGLDPLLDKANAAQYDRILKYARQYENSMNKALRTLGELQTESEFRRGDAPPEEQISEACRTRKIPRQRTSTVDRYLESLMHRHQESGSNWNPSTSHSPEAAQHLQSAPQPDPHA